MVNVSTHAGVELIDFSVRHVSAMNLRPQSRISFDHIPGYRDKLRAVELTKWAHTAVVTGDVVCCFGVIELWPGLGEAWMLTSDKIKRYPISLTRGAQRYFSAAANGLQLRRLQITTNVNDELAVRWANRLNFTQEGLLRSYGPDGSDHFMYSRIY